MSPRSTADVIATIATLPDLDGHDVTTADGEHPNMVAITCTCGYRANAVRRFADVLIAEHKRIGDAHLNPANLV